ncbi:MAG: hypothetical protein RLY83_796 [Actinomycetota bacterium]|jgi:uncharacterized LabA/DUF88 family protein
MAKPTAIIYVDGLNLYRQCLSGKPDLKWLDIEKLCEQLLPTHEVLEIKYFSALIKEPINKPGSQLRQRIYLRALRAQIPSIKIYLGKIRVDTKRYPLVPLRFGEDGRAVTVKVQKLEEKGTDVSIASHMVLDAAQNRSSMVALISSDGDFAPTIQIIGERLNVATGLISPSQHITHPLKIANPTLTKVIRADTLKCSQMPPLLEDSIGIIRRPDTWS